MANQQNYDYEEFDSPYNVNMERTDTIPSSAILPNYGEDSVSSPVNLGANVIDGASIDNFYIASWIKSQNYKPKSQGFLIHGELGYIECMQLYVGSGGMIGGSLDIPNKIDANSFHVAADGTTWWGANEAAGYSFAPAYVLPTGEAAFTNIEIHGRNGQALSDAINSGANLITDIINARIDTDSQQILADFDFGAVDYAGAVKSGSIAWNTSTGVITGGSGVAIYRGGIVGANAGSATFTINSVTGAAYFQGSIGSATSIAAPVITGGSIAGGEVIAGTIPDSYMLLRDTSFDGGSSPYEPYLRGYISNVRRMQLDDNSLEFFNSSTYKTMELTETGLKLFDGSVSVADRANFWTDGSFVYIDAGYTSIYGLIIRSLRSGTPPIAMFTNDGTTSYLSMQGADNVISAKIFNANADGYVNWGGAGFTGYGLRDNSGVIECKNNGENWTMLGGITENAQTGTTYTLVLTDSRKMVSLTNAAAIAATIPTNASVAFPIGTQIDLVQGGAGKVTFSGAGVTIESYSSYKSIAGENVGVSLIKTATDTWLLIGNLIA